IKVYHSSFVDDEGVNGACGCPLLPLKSHIKGLAPVSDQDRTDIVDEAITFFRANVFFRNFNIESPADKLLIYLTFYINAADKLLIALHTIERDEFVPFPTLQRSPQSELQSSRYDEYKTDT
ncbi:actin-related protein 2/3 complex subunit 3, partial [Medicago truncatula]|uniref:actin-related protein 2/3 complex subunit 3 n=1 Tax=Medicago truncatula TaxID=3880 RepID=UPI001966D332